MPIKFNCHKCGANLRVPEQHIGKKARCPKCDQKCVVPEVSQRVSSSTSGGNFGDVGNLIDGPMEVPMGLPVSPPPPMASPAMATPVAPSAPLPSSLPAAGAAASPYASPMTQAKRRGGGGGGPISGSVVQPLYEARTYIKIFGWAMFLLGILQLIAFGLQLITLLFGAVASVGGGRGGGPAAIGILLFGAIIGLIVPVIVTYIGWQLKSAGSNLTVGVETGDNELVRTSCQQLANYFRIMGIMAMVGLVLMGIALLIMLVGVFAAIASQV